MSSFNKIYLFVHDGFYCAHTGAGIHNYRVIRTLRNVFPTAQIIICPVYTSPQNPDLQPIWHAKVTEFVRNHDIQVLPIQNGSQGLDRYGNVPAWLRSAEYAAEQLLSKPLSDNDNVLCISIDTPFIKLIDLLADKDHFTHLHIPHSTGVLHSPDDTARLALERTCFGNTAQNTYIGAIGGFMRHHLTSVYDVPPSKIIMMNNGCLDEDQYVLSEEKAQTLEDVWHTNDDRKIIAAFGRSIEYKGFHLLVEAMSVLDRTKFRLLMNATTDSEQSQLYAKRLVTLASQHNVDLTLHETFDADFPAFIRRQDKTLAIVVPSLNEPFGLIPSEVMTDTANKALLIVSNTDGLAEQISHGHNGLVFESGDSESLKSTLLTAASMSKRDKDMILKHAMCDSQTRYRLEDNIRSGVNEMLSRLRIK